MNWSTIVSAILVIGVVIFAIVLIQYSYPLLKEVLGYGEQNVATQTPQSVKDTFNNFVENYKSCQSAKESSCICINNIPLLPSNYYIRFASGGATTPTSFIGLYQINSFNAIQEEQISGLFVKCTATNNKQDNSYTFKESDKMGLWLTFDNPSFVNLKEEESTGQTNPSNNPIIQGISIYKADNSHICFIAETDLSTGITSKTIDNDALNYFKNLPQCSVQNVA